MTYQLPYGTAFKSPHSGERNWRTANQNLILLSEAGQYSVVLNQHVDYDYVNGWLVDVYQRFWKEKGLA